MMRTVLGLGMAAVLMAAGCATMGGLSDEEQVARTVSGWIEAVEASDIDAIMAYVSEGFEGQGGADKAAYEAYMSGVIDAGYLDGAEVRDDRMILAVEGDTATVRNLDLSSFAGAVVIDLEMKRDPDGRWRISNMRN